jgi:peptidoglycan/xylan/chitin deacetylase (PgdA/CDA1 family)
MKLFLKSIITYLYSSVILKKNREDGLRVLMYHSITNEDSSDDIWSLGLNSFSEHLSYLDGNKNINLYRCTDLISQRPKDGIMITFDDGYRNNFEVAAPILFELKIPFSVFVITDFIKQAKKNFMNESMLKELAGHPLVSIGSHSRSHVRLTKCNRKELANEISGSKSYLEDLLGREIDMFSYPHGDFNSVVRSEVLKAEYKLGFTSHYDVNKKSQDKLKLNRNEIWNTDNLQTLKKKLQGDFDWLKYRSL